MVLVFIMTLFQRVLNDLYRARLSCGRTIRLDSLTPVMEPILFELYGFLP